MKLHITNILCIAALFTISAVSAGNNTNIIHVDTKSTVQTVQINWDCNYTLIKSDTREYLALSVDSVGL